MSSFLCFLRVSVARLQFSGPPELFDFVLTLFPSVYKLAPTPPTSSPCPPARAQLLLLISPLPPFTMSSTLPPPRTQLLHPCPSSEEPSSSSRNPITPNPSSSPPFPSPRLPLRLLNSRPPPLILSATPELESPPHTVTSSSTFTRPTRTRRSILRSSSTPFKWTRGRRAKTISGVGVWTPSGGRERPRWRG